MDTTTTKAITAFLRPLGAPLLALLVLQGCNALNPLCGGARLAPIIRSLSASTIAFLKCNRAFFSLWKVVAQESMATSDHRESPTGMRVWII
jgi:hypothetical protein